MQCKVLCSVSFFSLLLFLTDALDSDGNEDLYVACYKGLDWQVCFVVSCECSNKLVELVTV